MSVSLELMTVCSGENGLSVDRVNALKHKNFLPTMIPLPIGGGAAQRGQQGGFTNEHSAQK
jgi:hypothetical protein